MKAKILIVEDEQLVGMDLAKSLERLGYTITGAVGSGEEAIEKALDDSPNLIIMDIRLKGKIDGIAAAEAIRAEQDIPVVYLTAYADDTTLERAKATQPYGYILKPFVEREIYTTIEMALSKHGMERRMRENEKWLSTVLNSIKDGIIASDTEGKVTFMNPVAEEITGWSLQDAMDTPLNEVIDVVGAVETEKADSKPGAEQGAHIALMGLKGSVIRTSSGGELDVEHEGAFIHNELGEITGLVVAIRDISERKTAESELTRYREHLKDLVDQRTFELKDTNEELADANTALETFAYSVSHDLRAPLRAMEGFSQALMEDYADTLDETGMDYLTRVVDAAGRMDALIQDLLVYSRLNVPDIETERLHLESVILDAVAQLETMVNETGADVFVEDPLPDVVAHRPTLTTIFMNLLTNSFKFVDPNVVPIIRIWAEVEGETVRVWVEDNGIGIPFEYQQKVFQVFERLHSLEAYPGTGLGLAIVKKGLDRMDGYVGVESAPGKGSKFWVELPKAK